MQNWILFCLVLTTNCLWAASGFHSLFSQDFLEPQSIQSSRPALASPSAVSGQPFGVLSMEVPLPPGLEFGEPRVLVGEAQNRVFYPVVSVRKVEVVEAPRAERTPRLGRPGGLLDRIRTAVRGEPEKREVPVAITVQALFRGNEPLELILSGDIDQRISVVPNTGPNLDYRQVLLQWWGNYTQTANLALSAGDFPKLIHKYLVNMLASRFELPIVDLDPPAEDDKEMSQPLKTLSLLAAIEPLHDEIYESVLSVPADMDPTRLAPPSPPVRQTRTLPPVQPDVIIEPMATRIPQDCFYLRFGSFSNYLWFQNLTERYGGDIAQAVLLRGVSTQATSRVERMLAAKLTTIAKMFGDKIIDDMALFGTDLYMQEGASLGVVFKASNPGLLASAINSDRQSLAGKNDDTTLNEVTIAGRQVSLLRTPDNRVRSFMVTDGQYVCITTSQTLVSRFLDTGAGQSSLADSGEFQWARTWMPEANNYSVFAYLSPDFFHHLVSPEYQIELNRRLEAIAHLEIVEVAQQVAQAEGLPNDDVETMRSAGLLPAWFDRRIDGAQVLKTADGWIDSSRGARGSFLPIADVELVAVSPREAANYNEVSQFYAQKWRRMDPMLIGLRRFQAANQQHEQIAVEAYIAPFEAEKYGWIAQQLGAPTWVEIQAPADNIASAQVHVRGHETLGIRSDDYHLFGGVKDMIPPSPEQMKGLIRTLQALRAMPAYIGGWPKPGIIEQLPLGLGLTQPDYAGFSRLLGGLWRWDNGQFSVLSFDRSILEQAVPQLQPLRSNDVAQARVRVANLTGTLLADWINGMWYERAWRSSKGNAKLLDAMHQQLKVGGQNCLQAAERLLDAKLQCPLGGEYQFQAFTSKAPRSPAAAMGWWESTAWSEAAWQNDKPLPPPDYSAPWINWFRGGRVHVTQLPDSLSIVGEIELEMQPLPANRTVESAGSLPSMSFDIFGLPMKLFGQGKADQKPASQKF